MALNDQAPHAGLPLHARLTNLLVTLNYESDTLYGGPPWTVDQGADWLIGHGVVIVDMVSITTDRGTYTFPEVLAMLDELEERRRGAADGRPTL